MGETYENIPHVKKAVLSLKKHLIIKVPGALKLGGFINHEAKSKSIKMRIHWKDPLSFIATQNKGVTLELDAKSLESNMSFTLVEVE